MAWLPGDLSRRHHLVREARRIAALLAIVVVIRFLHSMTHEPEAIWVNLVLRLYYVPILVSAYWYGPFGGVLVAVAASVAYAPHLREAPALEEGRYAEIVFFHVVGFTVGVLAAAQRRIADRYQQAAIKLERANQELRTSYEQVQRADRLKTLGEVAAGLAHEIRHPLASIKGALEIIESRSAPGTPEVEFSQLAMNEVQRLDDLVWEFLRYARPHDPELRPTSLDGLVDRVVALLGAEAERAGVTLQVGRRELLVVVSVDALQIEQVLLNVILNAIQASPSGATVHIDERLEHDQVVVEVADRGSGISAEHLGQVFSPFFTTKEQGTGLGLSIAQRIVLSHRGRIDVDSSRGKGTRVRIHLPLHASTGVGAESGVEVRA